MKITVNEQPQQFWLAMKEWTPAVGHGIQVGDYQFCAIPIGKGDRLNVSEVTTGAKIMIIPVNIFDYLFISTKEGAIKFFYEVGERIEEIIRKHGTFGEELEKIRKVVQDRLGEMPEIINIELEELE